MTLGNSFYFVLLAIISSYFTGIYQEKNLEKSHNYVAQLYMAVTIISLFVTLGLYLFGPWVVNALYGVEFIQVTEILWIAGLVTLFSGLSTIAEKYLIKFNAYGYLKRKTFILVFFNIVFTFLMVKSYGLYGGIYAILMTEILSLTLFNYFLEMDLFGILKKECFYPLLISSGNEMLLSLIIPVYKVEQYIAECIESVINQVTSDIEVIIVNDGTPDDSMLVIEKILSKQTAIIRDCFIILHQENQGQSSARNLGLKYAKGEYISFLDSDDVLSENYLSDFKNTIKKNNVDIVQFKSSRFEEDTNKLKAFNVGLQRNGLLQLDQNLMIEIFNQSAWFPWLNIYRRELFNGLEFPVGIYYEDAALIPEVFLRAKNIYF